MRNPNRMLAVLWLAAASVGLLIAGVPLADEDPSAYLLAALLLGASVPFGLLRPSVPALWGLALAWPTVVIRLSQETGWQAVLLLVYPLVGVYIGDWIASWWAERHPQAVRRDGETAEGGTTAADGTAVDTDGLPPAVPGRLTQAARRAEEEARHDTGPPPPGSGPVTGLRP